MMAIWDFFRSPGPWYNLSNFIIAIVGLGLGTWGLVLAYVQIRKTLAAARAARDAAVHTAQKLDTLERLLDLEGLCRLAREVLLYVRTGRVDAASAKTHDLRVGIARVRESKNGAPLQDPAAWQGMITEVVTMQDTLEQMTLEKTKPEEVLKRVITTIAKIEQDLATLSSRAASASGVTDVNSGAT